jgi:aminomethyltransferase
VQWQGKTVGEVTSGAYSPTLNVGVGLAYVPADASKAGTRLDILVRDRPCAAEVTRPPFYKDGSIRR